MVLHILQPGIELDFVHAPAAAENTSGTVALVPGLRPVTLREDVELTFPIGGRRYRASAFRANS
jgi:hypothetical protein